MENILSVISMTPLFKGLPEDQLEDLASIAISKNCGRGEMIFSEEDEGNGFYVVISGKVKIFKLSFDGKEQILHIFGPGEPFGEVPVFTDQPFPASAATIQKSKLIFFPRKKFVDLISNNVPLVLSMLGVLSMRLRQLTIQIENLSLKEVPGRIAGYILHLREEQGGGDAVQLSISKGQLANLLGTIPETLSRTFSKMSDKGLIDVDGKSIKILDLVGLVDLAEHGKI